MAQFGQGERLEILFSFLSLFEPSSKLLKRGYIGEYDRVI